MWEKCACERSIRILNWPMYLAHCYLSSRQWYLYPWEVSIYSANYTSPHRVKVWLFFLSFFCLKLGLRGLVFVVRSPLYSKEGISDVLAPSGIGYDTKETMKPKHPIPNTLWQEASTELWNQYPMPSGIGCENNNWLWYDTIIDAKPPETTKPHAL